MRLTPVRFCHPCTLWLRDAAQAVADKDRTDGSGSAAQLFRDLHDADALFGPASGAEDAAMDMRVARAPFWHELRHLLVREFRQELPGVVNRYQLLQYVAISLLVGWIFFGVRSQVSQSGVTEVVSLLFYTTTLWTFTPLYAAIVRMRYRLERVQGELKQGLYSLPPYIASMFVVDSLLHLIWPMMYSVIVFAMADIGRDPSDFVLMSLVVVLCSLTYQSLGVLFFCVSGSSPVAMALATAFAQVCLLAPASCLPA